MRLLGFDIRRAKSPPTRFLGDLVKVDLTPRDICVLMASHRITPEDGARIRDLWRAAVGDDITLVVLDDGMRLGVLSPPQAAAVHDRITDEASVDAAVRAK